MLRTLLAGFGALELLAPARLVDRCERLAYENPEAARLRAWTLPMARLEGLAAVWLALRWERALPGLRPIVALVGVPAALAPRAVLAAALEVAYENPDEIEVRPWVLPATRLLGAVYLAVALFSARVDAPDETADDAAA
ncbi:hypothetical protein [Salinilacihabitans rarus]|uniref:hypothetical protein n=1 Tax=Salinilacihabitans rarus TaxID=2961596 RepID=UPI0020C87F34|nr:hypothetical protein [Salinilacihabitans rarus]